MRYDCHTHLFPPKRMGGLMRWIHRAIPDIDVPIDITADQAIVDLRANGAVRWANLLFPIAADEATGLNAFGGALADRVPEITPFGGVHIDDDDPLGVVEEALDTHGMAGLKFHPMVQQFEPWNPRLASVIDRLEQREAPIYIHTGYDDWYGYHIDHQGLEEMIRTHPRLPVVLPHIGFPDLAWGFGLADIFPNVWLDLTNVPASFPWMDLADDDELRGILFEGVDKHKDRVLVGSDYPAGMGNLQQILHQYETVGLADTLLEHVMVTTTSRFFDLYGRPRP